MERLTNNIATKISRELALDNDHREIIAYGMFAIVDIAFSILLVIIFGLLFHVVLEALIVSFSGSILRKYSGGAHATTPGKCAAIGTTICIGLALFLKFLPVNIITSIILGVAIFTISYYLINKLAPVDSPSKPIKKKEKKERMKNGSIFVLSSYSIFVIICIAIYFYTKNQSFLEYSLCVYGGTIWQVYTLTKAGHSTVHIMDKFLSQMLIYKKRR